MFRSHPTKRGERRKCKRLRSVNTMWWIGSLMLFVFYGRGENPGTLLRGTCGLVSAAIYFPQYHRDINNDIFWGRKFTEWQHLSNTSYDRISKHALRKPLVKYDLNLQILRKHASLATKHGIGAYIFYSYWFEHGRRVLERPLQSLLPKKRLGVSFALSWANEPWSRRWDGRDDGAVLIRQTYGNSFDWVQHYAHLSLYFQHPEYLKINGKPVLFIYNVRHIVESEPLINGIEGDCSDESTKIYGPGGEPAARLYRTWYPDVAIPLSETYTHWRRLGEAEGRNWPLLACTENPRDLAARQAVERQVDLLLPKGATTFDRMMKFFDLFAKRSGLHGIYIVATMGSFIRPSEFDQLVGESAHAAHQFLPMGLDEELRSMVGKCGCYNDIPWRESNVSECPPSCTCLMRLLSEDLIKRSTIVPLSVFKGQRDFFSGAFSFWSNYPRYTSHPEHATAFCSNPDFHEFENLLVNQFFLSLSRKCQKPRGTNEATSLLILNAWNEWGEQAVLEPNSVDGRAALLAHKRAVFKIEKNMFKDGATLQYTRSSTIFG